MDSYFNSSIYAKVFFLENKLNKKSFHYDLFLILNGFFPFFFLSFPSILI